MNKPAPHKSEPAFRQFAGCTGGTMPTTNKKACRRRVTQLPPVRPPVAVRFVARKLAKLAILRKLLKPWCGAHAGKGRRTAASRYGKGFDVSLDARPWMVELLCAPPCDGKDDA